MQLVDDQLAAVCDEQIAAAAAEVEGRTELDALVAYLQGLGTNRRARR